MKKIFDYSNSTLLVLDRPWKIFKQGRNFLMASPIFLWCEPWGEPRKNGFKLWENCWRAKNFRSMDNYAANIVLFPAYHNVNLTNFQHCSFFKCLLLRCWENCRKNDAGWQQKTWSAREIEFQWNQKKFHRQAWRWLEKNMPRFSS